MRRLLALTLAMAAQGAVLDRIAVTIGKQVITERDVIQDLRVSAFLDHKPVQLNADEKRKAADRLVDQALILQEAAFSRVSLAETEDARKALVQIRQSTYPGDGEYRGALTAYGISEDEVVRHLLNGLRAMRFADFRFRPEVQLSDEDLHDRYDRLVEEWRKGNAKEIPTFSAARQQVESLLTEERIAQSLDRWLGSQRGETQILYREQAFQ
jgi:hypothetical protein